MLSLLTIETILILLATIFLVLGYFINREGEKRKHARTISTKGVVTGYQERVDEDGHTVALCVSYVDDQGKLIEGVTDISKTFSLDKFPIGREVTILYDPLDSSKFIVKEFDVNVLGLVGKIFMGVGLLLLLSGGILTLF